MAVHTACTVNIPADSIKTRWLEPYVSAGLNQRSIGLQPKGVFAGFTVVPGAAPLTLEIQVDASLGISGANVLETAGDKYCVTLIQPTNLSVDLTSVAGTTVYVVLDAQYAVAVTTAAQVLVVDEADLAGSDYVTLAKVTVPGAGILPASAINMGYRLLAGDSITSESRPTINLLPNGNFERDAAAGLPTGWTSSGGGLVLSVDAAVSHAGTKSMKLAAAGAVTLVATSQAIVATPGTSYRVGGWIRAGAGFPIAGAGTGVTLQIDWLNAAGGTIATSDVETAFKSASLVFEARKAELTAPADTVSAKYKISFDNVSGVLHLDGAEFSARNWDATADAGLGYAGGPTWADGTTNPPTTVEAQLDKIITDLAGVNGAEKIGNAPSKIQANTFTQPNTFTSAASNTDAVIATGNGTGAGVFGTGGATGFGVVGVSGGTLAGVLGEGGVSAIGVSGLGGTASGAGVLGEGQAVTTNAHGVVGLTFDPPAWALGTNGPFGVLGRGSEGDSGITDGIGVVGVGASAGAYSAGVVGLSTETVNMPSVVAGVAGVATAGSPGVYGASEGGNGAGGAFQGHNTGAGVVGNGGLGGGPCFLANPTGGPALTVIGNAGGINYTSTRAMTLVLSASAWNWALPLPSGATLEEVGYGHPPSLGGTLAATGRDLTLATQFRLPLNAVITGVTFGVDHGGTTGTGLAALAQVLKLTTSGGGWSSAVVVNTALSLSAGASVEALSPAVTGVASDKTVLAVGDIFSAHLEVVNTSAVLFRLNWMSVSYTMLDFMYYP